MNGEVVALRQSSEALWPDVLGLAALHSVDRRGGPGDRAPQRMGSGRKPRAEP